jgi:uncharacterized protein YceH (UPF0502 family)
VEPADAFEIRVLGCLVEKQRTTPDVYPLSLNSLRLACNQSTNREPVVDYDEPTIRAALDRLSRRGWARLASGQTSRAIKYRQLVDEALKLDGREVSLLAVLMLRGPQTPGELNQRCERLYRFSGLDEVERTLAELGERDLVESLPRRPGQKEQRYRQLLGDDGPGGGGTDVWLHETAAVDVTARGQGHAAPSASAAPAAAPGATPPPPAPGRLSADLDGRVAAVEERMAALEELVRRLQERGSPGLPG